METPCGEAGGAIGQADLRRAAIAKRHNANSALPPVYVLDVVKNEPFKFGAIRSVFKQAGAVHTKSCPTTNSLQCFAIAAPGSLFPAT